MLIVHLSDLHIAGFGKKSYGIASTAKSLTRCIKHINQLTPQPDLVLVTGDITYNGELEEAAHAAQLLSGLKYPYYIIPGNHDSRSVLREIFAERGCPTKDPEFLHYVIDGYPIRFIALDSSTPGAAGGEICRARAKWLSARLSENSEQPTILYMHHPPLKCGVLETDEDGFVGADILGDIVEQYPNIHRIFCGHIHLESHSRWRGTTVTTAPSMGLQLGLDLSLSRPSEFYLSDPGYQLHYYTPEKNLISYTISVKEMDGPYLFEENSVDL